MIRRLIRTQLDATERKLGESLDYLRHVLRVSLRAFFKFGLFMPLAEHRRVLAPAPYRVARLVATRDEDCGACVQIEVNLAVAEGVDPDVLRATVQARPDDLPEELGEVYRFAESVARADGAEAAPRERVRARYGEEGLVELALAIAAARVFPVTKRALGYATSCRDVEIDVPGARAGA